MHPPHSHIILLRISYQPSHVTTLALIKCGPTLDPITPLATQLYFLNLFRGDETPYESLRELWCKAMVQSICRCKGHRQRRRCKNGSDIFIYFNILTFSQSDIPMTKKKFVELELSLLHLKQNVEIIHPVIQRTVEQVFDCPHLLLFNSELSRHKQLGHVPISRKFQLNCLTTARF